MLKYLGVKAMISAIYLKGWYLCLYLYAERRGQDQEEKEKGK